MEKKIEFNDNMCPKCEGVGVLFKVISQYWEEDVRTKQVDCPLCRGTGKIDGLQLSIYKARGNKVATVERRGFA